jgi:hypothetical protein
MTKKLLFSLLLALPIFGQATVPIQMPGDAAVQVTLSAQAVTSMISAIEQTTIGVSPTTLNGALTSTATSVTLTSGAGISTCNGLMVDSELMVVTAVSGNTVTVTRGTIGTTAASHLTGAKVTITQSGNGSCWLANLMANQVNIAMTTFPASTITAALAAIATQQATIASTVAAGVTHVP